MPNRVFILSTKRGSRGPLAAAGALAVGALLVTAAIVASVALVVIGAGAALALGAWSRIRGGAGASTSEAEAGPFMRPDGVIEGVRYAEARVQDRPPHQPPR